jgi:hypothetical protein
MSTLLEEVSTSYYDQVKHVTHTTTLDTNTNRDRQARLDLYATLLVKLISFNILFCDAPCSLANLCRTIRAQVLLCSMNFLGRTRLSTLDVTTL